MKTLLINPPPKPSGLQLCLPEGIARIYSYLVKYGIDASLECLDIKSCRVIPAQMSAILEDVPRLKRYVSGCEDDSLEKMVTSILEVSRFKDFDVVGFSVTYPRQMATSLLLAYAMKKRKNIMAVFGGPFFSCREPKRFMRLGNVIDYIIMGSGEMPFYDLLRRSSGDKRVKLHKISGLVYRKGNHIMQNKIVQPDLNTLPWARYDSVANEYITAYKKMPFIRTIRALCESLYLKTRLSAYLSRVCDLSKSSFANSIYKNPPPAFSCQISQGCDGGCSFCNYTNNRSLMLKSPKLITAEIKKLVQKHAIRGFVFGCNAVNLNKVHLYDLCSKLIQAKVKISWSGFAKPELLDTDLLRVMRLSGCRMLIFGIESGSKKVCNWLNKKHNLHRVEEVVRSAKEAGISTKLCFIIGTPVETEKDIMDTTSFIERNKKFISIISIQKFFVGYGARMRRDDNTLGAGAEWSTIRNGVQLKRLFSTIRRNNIPLELSIQSSQKEYFAKLITNLPLKNLPS